MFFLWVRDIDRVYELHRANGAEMSRTLTVWPWGVRQYVVREPEWVSIEDCRGG